MLPFRAVPQGGDPPGGPSHMPGPGPWVPGPPGPAHWRNLVSLDALLLATQEPAPYSSGWMVLCVSGPSLSHQPRGFYPLSEPCAAPRLLPPPGQDPAPQCPGWLMRTLRGFALPLLLAQAHTHTMISSDSRGEGIAAAHGSPPLHHRRRMVG